MDKADGYAAEHGAIQARPPMRRHNQQVGAGRPDLVQDGLYGRAAAHDELGGDALGFDTGDEGFEVCLCARRRLVLGVLLRLAADVVTVGA